MCDETPHFRLCNSPGFCETHLLGTHVPRLSDGRFMDLSKILKYLAVLSSVCACGLDEGPRSTQAADPITSASVHSALSVEHILRAEGCTTSAVNALSRQLIDEINCLRPNTLVDFSGPNMVLGNAVFPFLQGDGPRDLQAAIQARGRDLNITSALRTLPQQYLLYSWYRAGQCGIRLAARPGDSRHESGLSIDIRDASGWRPFLADNDFRWLGERDPVHFDYTGPGTVDLRGLSIRAFQRLWNRNNPGDQIVEDGLYGPQTEGRINQSPSAGFPVGGCEPDEPADMDMGQAFPNVEDMYIPFDGTVNVDAMSPLDIGTSDASISITFDAGMPADTGNAVPNVDTMVVVEDALAPSVDAAMVRRRQSDAEHVGGCAQVSNHSALSFTLIIAILALIPRWRTRK